MKTLARPKLLLAATTLAVCAASGLVLLNGSSSAEPAAKSAARSKEWKIRDAISAAPPAVAKDATILDWPEKDGAPYPVLREGHNGWTCLPDDPRTPSDDPWCMDKPSKEWFDAYTSGQAPKLTQPGLNYMLKGGSDPSNTDPSATKPPGGQDWMHSPPHLMVFPTGKLDPNLYGTDPNTGRPWIMWAGTPYEHLMIPVQ